ncbi:MAG: hypothetical protein LBQ64_01290 [Bacteroidales bacterium]|nr:hypothetical protein [Bacteroidales bacterium]
MLVEEMYTSIIRPRRGQMFIEEMYTSVVRSRRGRIETHPLVSINIRCLRHQFHPCGIFYACENLKYTQHSIPDGTAAGVLHSVFYQHCVPNGTGVGLFVRMAILSIS